MTPALNAMVKAMGAEFMRQHGKDTTSMDFEDGIYLRVDIDDHELFDLEKVARAGLAAIQEPTDEMITAVDNDDLMAWECFRGDGAKWSPADVFHAMIGAALSNPPS